MTFSRSSIGSGYRNRVWDGAHTLQTDNVQFFNFHFAFCIFHSLRYTPSMCNGYRFTTGRSRPSSS